MIRNSRIENNRNTKSTTNVDNASGRSGGGIFVHESTGHPLLVDRTVLIGNSSTQGSAVGNYNGDIIIRNSLFAGNTSEAIRNGASNGGGYLEIDACTVVQNTQGIQNANDGMMTVRNSIIHANLSGNYGGKVAWGYSCSEPLPEGEGMISDPPLFVNADAGDFRLNRESPGVNAGTNLPWMVKALDLGGRPRLDVRSGRVDMGAYEYQPPATTILFK